MSERRIERTWAGIVRRPSDEVEEIRRLLADAYKDAGDGRTIVRELVQNADDARATRLVFAVLDAGFPEATNSLLRGPALVVANDGPFSAEDRDGLHRAIGGSKGEAASKVGRFGLGLKSVFHLCEAIVYVGRGEDGVQRPGALNPWAGTGTDPKLDPKHPDWDEVVDGDLAGLEALWVTMLVEAPHGLVLWIPLRRRHHLDRAEEGSYGISDAEHSAGDIDPWFAHPDNLALLLAQCGSVTRVEALRLPGPGGSVQTRARLDRTGSAFLGRPSAGGSAPGERRLDGELGASSSGPRWRARGLEVWGPTPAIDAVHADPHWPRNARRRDGTLYKRKAEPHAAITVVRPVDRRGLRAVRLRWAVFFPLDDHPSPTPRPAIEVHGEGPAWEVLLHGYFWPASDRRSIPGVTSEEAGADSGESAVRRRWNQTLLRELLLPALPRVLADVAGTVEEAEAVDCIRLLARSEAVTKHRDAVTSRHVLLPRLGPEGLRYEAVPTGDRRVLVVPRWRAEVAAEFRRGFARAVGALSSFVVVAGDAARLGGEPQPWPREALGVLLDAIPEAMFHTPAGLDWLGVVLEELTKDHDEARAVVADWLARRIGAGALPPKKSKERESLRRSWRTLLSRTLSQWVKFVPIGAEAAVVDLAAAGHFGANLLPIPFGYEETVLAEAAVPLADEALRELGARLLAEGARQKVKRGSWLDLADVLLAARGAARAVPEDIAALPLLSVVVFEADQGREAGWSLREIEVRGPAREVFAGGAGDGEAEREEEDDGEPAGASAAGVRDPRQAVADLALALEGASVGLVRGRAARLRRVPEPSDDALRDALLGNRCPIAAEPARRRPLLERLAEGKKRVGVPERAALRALLRGARCASSDQETLYYVESTSFDRDGDSKTLRALLSVLGSPDREVPGELAGPLSGDLLSTLGVEKVDRARIGALLDEALELPVEHWRALSESEVFHLLGALHRDEDSAARERWRRLPLHRLTDGGRASIGASALRVRKPDVSLPPELAAEVQLLWPDAQVEGCYRDIDELTDEALVRRLLSLDSPHRFAEQIRQRLPTDLSDWKELRDALRAKPWIPLEGGSAGVAPRDVLILPPELAAVVSLTASALTPPKTLEAGVKAPFGSLVRQLKEGRQVEQLASALDGARVAAIDAGRFLVAPEGLLDEQLVLTGLSTRLPEAHMGWRLLSLVLPIPLREKPAEQLPDQLLKLAQKLTGALPSDRQVELLLCLASEEPKPGGPASQLFERLLGSFAKEDGFRARVLPRLRLPTEAGDWRGAAQIAASATGVAKGHLLLASLRQIMGLSEANVSPPMGIAAEPRPEVPDQASRLRAYFRPWEKRVPPEAVGIFIAMLGDWPGGGGVELLAREWLRGRVEVSTLREELADPWQNPAPPYVHQPFVAGRKARVVSLSGDRFEAELEEGATATLFAVDPVRRPYAGQRFCWELALREPGAEETRDQLLARLEGALEWWACTVLKVKRPRVQEFWKKWGAGSQAALGPVRALILADLPLTLRQLNIAEIEPLAKAINAVDEARRNEAQATPGPRRNQASEAVRRALHQLAALIAEGTDYHPALLERIRQRMDSFGYSPSSVLLELAQNADDALAQSEEIQRGQLDDEVRTLRVRVVAPHEPRVKAMVGGTKGSPAAPTPVTVELIHFGRAINDTGGSLFPQGAQRQWDRDLYFMMLMNLSGKPGESPGSGPGHGATTGRFGLGFKSVHLVSDAPTVDSGHISFRIAAGLLPEEIPRPTDLPDPPSRDVPVTRIRMPLRRDVDPNELLGELFRRFEVARAILPAFARQIRRVVVEGGPSPGQTSFDPEPLAPGWSVGREPVEIDGARWQLLRFRPSDVGGAGDTTAILVGARDGGFRSFPKTVPFLWNVLPTDESWNAGYAINGPFHLDPGRKSVDLSHESTVKTVRSLGEALGAGLIALHDAVSESFGLEELGQLWKVLATRPEGADSRRGSFLTHLHGEGRGLSCWMAERSVVPTGLPAPFALRLPPLVEVRVLDVVQGVLAEPVVCAALAKVPELSELARSRHAVCEKVVGSIEAFHPSVPTTELRVGALLEELFEGWDRELTPERFTALGPVLVEEVWRRLEEDAKRENPPEQARLGRELKAKSQAGQWSSLRSLLIPLGEACAKELQEEAWRAAFAPAGALLGSDYVDAADPREVESFRRLRGPFEAGVEQLVRWICEAPPEKRVAAVRYLAEGEQSSNLQNRLDQTKRESWPEWLRTRSKVLELLEEGRVQDNARRRLISVLFKEGLMDGPPQQPAPHKPLPPEVADRLLEELYEEWSDESHRERLVCAWRDQWYPSDWPDARLRSALARRPADDDDEAQQAWMILFVLATVQGIGRTKAVQHRGFVEALMSRKLKDRSWWNHLFHRDADADSWFAFFVGWANARNGDKLQYDHWFTKLPELFPAWHWLDEYHEIVRSADRRDEVGAKLLAPRADPERSFAGDDPPALPVVRHRWLLRELLRLGILEPTPALREAAWPYSRRFAEVLRLLGAPGMEDESLGYVSRESFSSRAWAFLCGRLGEDRATFFRLFDLPLTSHDFWAVLEQECEKERVEWDKERWKDEGGGWLGDDPDAPSAPRRDAGHRRPAPSARMLMEKVLDMVSQEDQ